MPFDLGGSVFQLQFGYQDSAHQLTGGSARQSPETSSLLGRVPAQALFGAGPAPSYGGQSGMDGGHLFQDLGMLSLPREKAGRPEPPSTRLQHSLRLPSNYRDMEEKEQPAPLASPATPCTDRYHVLQPSSPSCPHSHVPHSSDSPFLWLHAHG